MNKIFCILIFENSQIFKVFTKGFDSQCKNNVKLDPLFLVLIWLAKWNIIL